MRWKSSRFSTDVPVMPLIGVNIDHFPIRIAGDQFRIVLILHAVGIELIPSLEELTRA